MASRTALSPRPGTPASRIAQLEARVAEIEALADRQTKELETQFKRIAQLQADLDHVRLAWAQVRDPRRTRAG
jgi:hypothetical protein